MPWRPRFTGPARAVATRIAETVLVGLAGYWTFFWGNTQLIFRDHDALHWGLVNFDQVRSGAVWLGANMSLNQGLGTWNDVHSSVLDLPLLLSSLPDGLMRESVYGGLAVAALYAAGAFLAGAAGASRGVSRANGVLLCFVTILPSPFLWARVAYSMRSMHFAIALGAVLLGSVIALAHLPEGERRRRRALLAASAASASAIPLVTGAQAPFALAGPAIAATAFIAPAVARTWVHDRRALLSACAAMAVVVVPVSLLTVDLVRQSAAGSGSPLAVSIAVATARETGTWGWTFDGLTQSFSWYRPVVIGAWIVALLAGFAASRARSRIHWSALVTLATIQIYGMAHTAGVLRGSEVSPRPEYLFLSSIPVLCLLCTTTAATAAGWVRHRFVRRDAVDDPSHVRRWRPAAVLLIVPVWLAAWTVDNRALRNEPTTFPPGFGADAQRLADDYGLSDNQTFRGRVLYLHTTTDEEDFDGALGPSVAGGDPHLATLHADVPFLGVHSSFQTAPFVEFMSTFFADGAPFIRNWTVPTELDPAMAALAGVSTVLTEQPLDVGLAGPAEGIRLGAHDLYRYDVAGANVGDVSPTRVLIADGWSAAFARMQSPGFDPRRDVVLATDPGVGLVPATATSLRVDHDRLHVSATSAGTSLLVLPFEYSACAQVTGRGGNGSIRLLRANGLFLGVEFTGNLDATIAYRTGLLRSGCLSAP